MRFLMTLLLLSSPALAKEFSVSDQDQAAIQTVCDMAAASPSLNRDVRAQVAAWCVSWEKRIAEANNPEPSPPPAPAVSPTTPAPLAKPGK